MSTKQKTIHFLFLIGTILLLVGCGHGAEENLFTGEEEQTSISDHPKLQNLITFDVLGGVFRSQTVAIQASIFNDPLADSKSIPSASGMTLNLKPPASQGTSETYSEPIQFDTSLSFSGLGGRGSLVLVATGTGTRLLKSEESDDIVAYHYEPLVLRFLFYKYAYSHPCLGTIRLDGEIHCVIEGDYDSRIGDFLGTAHCLNGPINNAMSLLYITEEANYEITYDATLQIDGNPFIFNSYTVTGDISIDGESMKIESLIGEGASCSY